MRGRSELKRNKIIYHGWFLILKRREKLKKRENWRTKPIQRSKEFGSTQTIPDMKPSGKKSKWNANISRFVWRRNWTIKYFKSLRRRKKLHSFSSSPTPWQPESGPNPATHSLMLCSILSTALILQPPSQWSRSSVQKKFLFIQPVQCNMSDRL